MLARELIEEIRQANEITSVISGYLKLKRSGNSLVGLCPFHNEKTPSFHVSEDNQSFHCFGCGEGGNVITFVMMIENYDYLTAIKFLADRANIPIEHTESAEKAKAVLEKKNKIYDIHNSAARFFYDCLQSDAGADCAEYIKKRGLSRKMQVKCGLGYAPSGRGGETLYGKLKNDGYDDEILLASGLVLRGKKGIYDRFFDRLMFPIFDVSGKVAAFGGRSLGEAMPKYLNSPETPIFEKGRLLYGLNFARGAKNAKTGGKREIVIVEGYMDAISMYQAGFMRTVASLGTAFTQYQARLLKNYADSVIILYDSDEAGVKAVYRAVPQLVKSGLEVKVARTGEKAKDPDEFIKEYGAEGMERLLEAAISHIAFKLANERKLHDLEKIEGRVAFTKQAASILREIDSDIERDAYIKETARVAGISEAAIRSESASPGEQNGRSILRRRAERAVSSDGAAVPANVVNAQRRLLSLIASNDRAFEKAVAHIDETDFTSALYKDLFGLIAEFRRENRLLRAEELTSCPCFDTVDKQREVNGILMLRTPGMELSDIEKDFNGQIKLIKRYGNDMKIRELAENEDGNALQTALNRQKSLERLYISLSDG